MRKRKEFDECIEDNKLLEIGIKDESMAKELFALAEQRELFWDSVKNKSKDFPSLFLEGYYEIIKELCTAFLALEGWKALDHECMFAYLKNKKLDIDFEYLLELKDTINSIDYRGLMVSYDTWKNNEIRIKIIIKDLKKYIIDRIKKI